MIYLLRSPAWIEKDRKFIHVLKIGWTDDKNSEKRFKTYLSHNPTAKVLYKFPGFGLDVEAGLHSKFSSFRFFGNEWYKYCDDILNFFSSPNIIVEMRAVGEIGKKILERKSWRKKQQIYRYILELVSSEYLLFFPKADNILSEEDWWEVVKNKMKAEPQDQILLEEIVRKFDSTLDKYTKDVILHLATLKTYEKRSKYLREIDRSFSDAELDNLLKNWIDEYTLKLYENG